jgi:hypothetical protein
VEGADVAFAAGVEVVVDLEEGAVDGEAGLEAGAAEVAGAEESVAVVFLDLEDFLAEELSAMAAEVPAVSVFLDEEFLLDEASAVVAVSAVSAF